VAIEACNRAINSGQYHDVDLANAYMNRGAEFLRKREYDRTIADANASIKLFPTGTLAYNNRGRAYQTAEPYFRVTPRSRHQWAGLSSISCEAVSPASTEDSSTPSLIIFCQTEQDVRVARHDGAKTKGALPFEG
jgi:tetratricopeptide (TPR) repeat protein